MKAASEAETDALIRSYTEWRDACREVDAAYRAWQGSRRAARDAAFGGYMAALQHEQHSARVYQGQLELLRQVA
jgi:hypothetical protein